MDGDLVETVGVLREARQVVGFDNGVTRLRISGHYVLNATG